MEYVKVLLAYVLLIFIYPSILFRSYLKGKGRVFWFFFCVSEQILLISTVVLLLGLFGLLNVWVCRALFYGSLIWSISRSVHPKTPLRYFVHKVQNRTYGVRLLLLRLGSAIAGGLRKMADIVRRALRGNVVELIALAVIVIYGMIYFTYGAFQERYFGFGDMYVHHSWIYGLIQGKSFSHGIYPEGMHTVLYAFYALFGIRVYSGLLFLQGVHVVVFLLGAYALIRELFPWRYSGLLILTAFLTLNLKCFDEVFSMGRLQWTLPQEFALYTVFTIPMFLVRYLKHAGKVMHKGKLTRMFWSDDLLGFAMGIAVSFSVHFYATFMAIYACVGVAVIWFGRLLHWRRFVPTAASAILAVLFATVPMGIAFAEGIPFQGSIYWALGVMEGKYDQSGSTEVVNRPEATEPPAALEDENSLPGETTPGSAQAAAQPAAQSTPQASPQPTPQSAPQLSLREKIQKKLDALSERIAWGVQLMAWRKELYYGIDGMILLDCYAVCLGAWLLWRGLGWIIKKTAHVRSFPMGLFDGYATMAVICTVFLVMISSEAFGLPPLVAGSRLLAVKNVFLLSVFAIPLDLLGTLLASSSCCAGLMQCMGAAGAVAGLALIVASGQYHSYLYYEASRFPAAAEVSNLIIETAPKDQFTVVSTTDEIYQINLYGYHEEYQTFLKNYKEDGYYLPTPYVFFYVEKHPLQYGHIHYLDGPEWLALCRYQDYVLGSVGEERLTGEISDDKADREIVIKGTKTSLGYTELFNRETVESAAARYMRILQSQYPNNISVFYEDEDFVCYCLKQNPDRLIEFRYRAGEGSQ